MTAMLHVIWFHAIKTSKTSVLLYYPGEKKYELNLSFFKSTRTAMKRTLYQI